jgi:F-type H+-transporting ATPase subunit a
MGMSGKWMKSLLVAVLTFVFTVSYTTISAQEKQEPKTEKKSSFDANEVIFGHVLDAHQFHFLSYEGSDKKEHHVTIPLPVILYSPQKGFSMFMSSKFHDGEDEVDGYKIDAKGKIFAVDPSVKVYDISLTRNVVQMLLALTLLIVIMTNIAKKYKSGQGVTSAPKGMQSLVEPVITFVRDEVAKPNLGHKYMKYFPYLLTVFFFILINNLVGLIPGSANVTGNIAFTMVLAVISFIVILASSNKHYWGHIFNPPVPGGVKPILVLVEFLGVFTKPFALMIRLFANMIAGHIIIICLISLIFIFGALNSYIGWGFSPLSVAFVIFIYFIELLVAFLQAYIFTNLTAVFIGQAFESSRDELGHEDTPVI